MTAMRRGSPQSLDLNRPRLTQETLFAVDRLQQPDGVLAGGYQNATAAIAAPPPARLVLFCFLWSLAKIPLDPMCSGGRRSGEQPHGCPISRFDRKHDPVFLTLG